MLVKVTEILNEAQTPAQKAKTAKAAKRMAAQAGNFDKKMAFSLMGSLAKIIKKHAKGDDWDYHKSYLDQGLDYTGTDTETANKVIDAIIGDMYGYFVDGSAKDRVMVKHSDRVAGNETQDVYTVIPMGKFTHPMGMRRIKQQSQLEFFRFKQKPSLGVLFSNIPR